MWKIRINILLVASLIIGLSACNTKEKTPSKTEIIQKENMDSIEVNLEPLKVTSKELTFNHQDSLNIDFTNEYVNFILKYDEKKYFGLYDDLLYEDMFVKVMENSNPYLDNAIKLLNTGKMPKTKIDIILASMATLTLENRIKFIEFCCKVYKMNFITKSQLNGSFGSYFGDHKLFFEYKNEKIISLLNQINHDDELPNTIKDFAKKVLRGDLYKRYKTDKEHLKIVHGDQQQKTKENMKH